MKPIQKDELFEHLGQFLKGKGIELKQGSYAQGIQKGCSLLTDAINVSQRGIRKAKVEIDRKLDQMRQVIHEKTAPRAKANRPATTQPSGPGENGAGQTAGQKSQAKPRQKPGSSRPKAAKGQARPKRQKS